MPNRLCYAIVSATPEMIFGMDLKNLEFGIFGFLDFWIFGFLDFSLSWEGPMAF
jgi:hypothetical protein